MRKHIVIAIALCTAALWVGAQPVFAQYGPGGMSVPVQNPDNGLTGSNSMPPEKVLSANPTMAAKLQTLLPADLPVSKAAEGYAKYGEFTVALRAAHDLNLPFAQFKCTELGGKYCTPETKAKGMNLGKTIQTLKPDMAKGDLKNAEKQAKKEAKDDTP